ncbi:cytochrome o ubiquinol oxidase subunit IV [Cupriavidus sp. WKF15]|uniref:cytochrome o ubiquinol oxidase subunit IV n=1 Tax=Cupriavidus sp. WKF15 TaxID=3032282 RepID=UPI0023E1DBA1|nr:cytochrome o ubiquinol oxidase subunit IV [Cupriavidus sp. WKF15]WER44864.1 cytochrome o ubiquinol oxidase subunit IV [Cupriavidus sp. WKF15]
MAQQHAASAHAESHGHSSFKSYVIGFVLAVVLTVIPFKIVMDGTMDRGTTLLIILGMAAVQVVVHLKYFLHMDGSKQQRWNVMSFLFTLLILFIVLAGSLWIMHNMNANMMPWMMK